MPHMDLKGAQFWYQLDGAEGSPVLMLSNSLASALTMWEPQVAPFSRHFRLLRYDQRGHGKTAVTPGPYTSAQLGGDALALLDALKIPRAHFLGLSMGGAAGMWLATQHPARVNKLVLSNTAAKFGTPEVWNTRMEAVRKGGMAVVADATIERWFTAGFRAASAEAVAAIKRQVLATDPAGYLACSAAIRDNDQQESIRSIRAPTLVIAGTHDAGTPPAANKLVADRIPGARYVELDAAHISNIEAAAEYTQTVLDFLLA
jgi:3-oxoadipate enol-lactonase